MFANNPGLFLSPLPTWDRNAVATKNALNLYLQVRNNGWLNRLKTVVTGHKRQLMELEEPEKQAHIHDRHFAGIRSIPLRQIHGTEGRSHDFD